MRMPGAGALEIYAGAAAIARLEGAAARGSPFQSPAWLAAWLGARRALDHLRLVEIAVEGGRWLLPLECLRLWGITLLRKCGGGHASFFTPLALGAPRPLTAADLDAACRALRADALILTDCPPEWAGRACLGSGFPAAPDIARGLALRGGASPRRGGKAAKKLRAKARKLAGLGTLDAGFLAGEAAQAALAALLGWKCDRFRAMGVKDAFAPPAVQDFLRRGLGAGGGLRLFALCLDQRPIAALVLAQSGDHASGMANAHSPEAEIARCGPGDVLLAKLVEALEGEGLAGFDLGVGDARYKRRHCQEAIALHDIFLAQGARGRALVALARGARRLKAAIKHNERLFAALRSLREKLRGRGSRA